MAFQKTREYHPPENNLKGKKLGEGPDSLVGLTHKQTESPETVNPYTEDYAEVMTSRPGLKPAMQGPNEQSIVASGMTVEEWKLKHPKAVMGPKPEDVGQVTTDPPDGSEPEARPMEPLPEPETEEEAREQAEIR